MPRKANPAPITKEVAINEAVIKDQVQAVNQLATLERAASDNVMALATQLGYDGALSVGALEDGIRFYQQRTAEACLELGKRLVLLKEASLHGEFAPRLELLGIEYQSAKKFMAASIKFSKRSTSTLLKAANSQSKLLELLTLDDEEVVELAEGGTVRGMTADAVSSMGVRELRAALREANAEKDATDKLVANLHKTNDKLSRHIAKLTPDQKLAELQKEATGWMRDAQGAVRGQLRQALIAVRDYDAAQDHSIFMAGLVGQVQADIAALREEFHLPDVSTAADRELAAEVAQWASPAKK